MNTTNAIFVIIVTHNGENTIKGCLQSLCTSKPPVKVIVIDNASTDHTREIIEQFNNCIFFPQEKNLGFGQANNIGMHYALENGAEYVFLLNQDSTINEDTISKLLQVASSRPDLGILSPMHLTSDGSQIDSKVITYLLKGIDTFLIDAYSGNLKDYYEVKFVNAAAWLISARCIKTVGGFDDLFFMYGEDDDYLDRACRSGFQVGIAPKVIVYHQREINLTQLNKWQNFYRLARNHSSLAKARLKKTTRAFLQEILLWRIDHLAQKATMLVKGQVIDFLMLNLAGTIVLLSLPKIWLHKKITRKPPAFWT